MKVHSNRFNLEVNVLIWLFLGVLSAQAQLEVTIIPPKISAQKAVVQLNMKNNLTEAVKSARAVCFLLDEQGKMVGQSTKWVIGGTKDRPALKPKEVMVFNFVITSPQPFTTTNLTPKVSFSRVVLSGDKLANPKSDVQIQIP
jgi:hypothetical protein